MALKRGYQDATPPWSEPVRSPSFELYNVYFKYVWACACTVLLPEYLQAQSGEWRRAMFLLCTLALAGTEDQLIQAKGKRDVWETLTWSGRLELRVRACRVCARCLEELPVSRLVNSKLKRVP